MRSRKIFDGRINGGKKCVGRKELFGYDCEFPDYQDLTDRKVMSGAVFSN